MSKRAKNLAYVAAQPPVAMPGAEIGDSPQPQATRPIQNRWPVAVSILGAIAVSLGMWAGIVWIISLFMGLFA